MKEFLKYLLLLLVISLVAVSLAFTFFKPDMGLPQDVYSLKIKENDQGWFYEIHAGDKLLIKQETIPAMAGNNYFVDKKDAEKIGAIVLSKVKHGVMPPTISMEEIENTLIRRRKRKH